MHNGKIAVIDNGIEEAFLKKPLEYKVFVTNEGQCVTDDIDMKQVSFRHGTTCAMIIEKYFPQCALSSIRVLDKEGAGMITKVAPALEWCLRHEIKVINLSLGSTHFKDKELMRDIINQYTAQGLLIIAATSNSGKISYPASFSNVIGVAAAYNEYLSFAGNGHLGLDVLAPVEHELLMEGELVELQRSNSYAAPYVTALAGRLSFNLASTKVCEIKRALRLMAEEHKLHFLPSYCEPDWIHTALDKTAGKKSNADYYFAAADAAVREGVDEADTVIAGSLSEIKEYAFLSKNIVCLDKGNMEHPSVSRFLWTPESRLRQILEGRYGEEVPELNIPVIICEWEEELDEIFMLSELKKCFFGEDYHIYAACSRAESVLYGLEYIPEEAMEGEYADAFSRFIYWQTYYKQNDALLLSLSPKLSDKAACSLRCRADLQVIIKGKRNRYRTSFIGEGVYAEDIILKKADASSIRTIYNRIKEILTENKEDMGD